MLFRLRINFFFKKCFDSRKLTFEFTRIKKFNLFKHVHNYKLHWILALVLNLTHQSTLILKRIEIVLKIFIFFIIFILDNTEASRYRFIFRI